MVLKAVLPHADKRRIKDAEIDEISLVDNPANKRKFSLFKREEVDTVMKTKKELKKDEELEEEEELEKDYDEDEEVDEEKSSDEEDEESEDDDESDEEKSVSVQESIEKIHELLHKAGYVPPGMKPYYDKYYGKKPDAKEKAKKKPKYDKYPAAEMSKEAEDTINELAEKLEGIFSGMLKAGVEKRLSKSATALLFEAKKAIDAFWDTVKPAEMEKAKQPPVCPKCGERHWPFQPCPKAKKAEKKPEKEEEDMKKAKKKPEEEEEEEKAKKKPEEEEDEVEKEKKKPVEEEEDKGKVKKGLLERLEQVEKNLGEIKALSKAIEDDDEESEKVRKNDPKKSFWGGTIFPKAYN